MTLSFFGKEVSYYPFWKYINEGILGHLGLRVLPENIISVEEYFGRIDFKMWSTLFAAAFICYTLYSVIEVDKANKMGHCSFKNATLATCVVLVSTFIVCYLLPSLYPYMPFSERVYYDFHINSLDDKAHALNINNTRISDSVYLKKGYLNRLEVRFITWGANYETDDELIVRITNDTAVKKEIHYLANNLPQDWKTTILDLDGLEIDEGEYKFEFLTNNIDLPIALITYEDDNGTIEVDGSVLHGSSAQMRILGRVR